jgi:hypothetical protein
VSIRLSSSISNPNGKAKARYVNLVKTAVPVTAPNHAAFQVGDANDDDVDDADDVEVPVTDAVAM